MWLSLMGKYNLLSNKIQKINTIITETPFISDIRKQFYQEIIKLRYEKILKYSYDKLIESWYLSKNVIFY